MEGQQVETREYEHEIIDHRPTLGWKFELKFPAEKGFVMKVRQSNKGQQYWLQRNTFVPMTLDNLEVVIVKGDTVEDAITTKNRLIYFFGPELTHILSMPLINYEIKRNYAIFRDEITNEFGLHKSIFQKPEKLHITIAMLILPNEQQEDKARECLASCKEAIIDPVLKGQTLAVTVSGVSVFNNENPEAAYIVFGNVKSEELQQIVNKVWKYFKDQGLGKHGKKGDGELLVALMNTKYYDNDQRFYNKPFDASKILKKYKDYNFGTMPVNEIHMGYIRSQKQRNGYFESIGSLKF